MHRTNKLGARGPPTHQLGDWQRCERCGRHRGDQVLGWLPGDGGVEDQPFTLVGYQALGLFDLDAIGAGPADRCRCWLAINKSSIDGWTTFFDLLIELGCGQFVHLECQTAWRGEPLDSLEGQFGLGQFLGEILGESFGQFAQGFWRQLFGAEFDQQILSYHAHTLSLHIGNPSVSRAA